MIVELTRVIGNQIRREVCTLSLSYMNVMILVNYFRRTKLYKLVEIFHMYSQVTDAMGHHTHEELSL